MDKFNIIHVIQLVKQHWRLFAKWIAGTFVFGCVIAFSLPKQFTATTTMALEISNSSSGGLNNMASLVGINLGSLQGEEDAINPLMYEDIVSSTPFLREIATMTVTTDDGELTTSLSDYIDNHAAFPWWGWIIRGIGMLLPTDDSANNNGGADPRRVSKHEDGTLKSLSKSIYIDQDNSTGLVMLSVTMDDPYIASVVADSVLSKLQHYIYEYRTKKASTDLHYTQGLCQQALKEYSEALTRYSVFSDTHQGLTRMLAKSEETELENDMSLKYAIYSTLKQQEAMAIAKVQSRTPVFNVVQPSTVPIKKSAPKRMFIVIFLEMLVCFSLLTWLLVKEWLHDTQLI